MSILIYLLLLMFIMVMPTSLLIAVMRMIDFVGKGGPRLGSA